MVEITMLFYSFIMLVATIFIGLVIVLLVFLEKIKEHLDATNHHLREIAEAIKNSRERPESSESGGNENESE